jgi:hypothetical protein
MNVEKRILQVMKRVSHFVFCIFYAIGYLKKALQLFSLFFITEKFKTLRLVYYLAKGAASEYDHSL